MSAEGQIKLFGKIWTVNFYWDFFLNKAIMSLNPTRHLCAYIKI